MKKAKWLITIPTLFMLVSCGTNESSSVKDSEFSKETTQSSSQTSSEKQKEAKEKLEKEKSEKEKQEKEKAEQDKIAKLEDTTDAAKYEEAYQKYSMQNNPKGVIQRGGSPISQRVLHLAGLTQEEYTNIMWGIYDYYGAAIEDGSLSEEKATELQTTAFENLKNGTYAKREIEPYEEVTLENAKFYAQQMIDKSMKGLTVTPTLIDPEIDGNGNFKIPYQIGPGSGGNGYIIITKDKIGRRYENNGNQLGDAIQLE